jgi:hypothetical protein
MDEGVNYIGIDEDKDVEAQLARDFLHMIDAGVYYKGQCIYLVTFFPNGMGEDTMVSDVEYLLDRRSALDAPPVPADRFRPAFELRRHIPPHSDVRNIVRGKGAVRLHAVRVVARGEGTGHDGRWSIAWAAPVPRETLEAGEIAARLADSAWAIVARYEALAATPKKGPGR